LKYFAFLTKKKTQLTKKIRVLFNQLKYLNNITPKGSIIKKSKLNYQTLKKYNYMLKKRRLEKHIVSNLDLKPNNQLLFNDFVLFLSLYFRRFIQKTDKQLSFSDFQTKLFKILYLKKFQNIPKVIFQKFLILIFNGFFNINNTKQETNKLLYNSIIRLKNKSFPIKNITKFKFK
jgi:hypothetical protein